MHTTGSSPEPGSPRGAELRAADVFVADLRPRRGGRLMHGVRIAGAFVSQLALQLIPAPDVHDVVVSRRDDGEEVLRVPAGDPLQPGEVLAHVRTELETLDPETFLAGWRPRARTENPAGAAPDT
jgi:hypothetical protein